MTNTEPTNAKDVINRVVEKRPGKKGYLQKSIIGILIVLVLGWYCFRTIPLKISPETTLVTEPRTADGKWIDYAKAFEQKYYPAEMKTNDNGYRFIVENIESPKYYKYRKAKPGEQIYEAKDESKELKAQAFEKLGLPPDHVAPMKFEEHYGFINEYLKKLDGIKDKQYHEKSLKLGEEMMNAPWILEKYPMMKEWFEQNGPALDIVAEAVRKPAFCVPIVNEGTENDTPMRFGISNIETAAYFRSFARSLQLRIKYRIGTGDIDGAIDDIITCQLLGRWCSRQGSLVMGLVGVAICGIGNASGIADNPEHQPTAEQIRRFIQSKNDLKPTLWTGNDAIESERYGALETLQAFAKGGEQFILDERDKSLGIRLRFKSIGVDWNYVFNRMNRHYDTIWGIDNTANDLLEPQSLFYNFFSRKSRSKAYADSLASLLFPAVQAAREAWRRLDCCENMQRITLAMLLYEAENGTLPPAFTVDEAGKPLHSWRVLILPYLDLSDATELYGKLRLDEPWDSEHNRQFHDADIPFYACQSDGFELRPGQASYVVVLGEDTFFDTSGKGKSTKDKHADGILVSEHLSVNGVCWMDPRQKILKQDVLPRLNRGTGNYSGLSSHHAGGINAGLRSGGVNFISDSIAEDALRQKIEGTAPVSATE